MAAITDDPWADSAATAPFGPSGVGATGIVLALLRSEGLAVLAGAIACYAALHGSWAEFALLFLMPDLWMLGYAAGRRVGAATYNATHTYLGPCAAGLLV